MKQPPSQMILGAMLCLGAVGLHFILPNTTINRPKYVEVLKEKLKLHIHDDGCAFFMQDGAPCHRSMIATEFLRQTPQDRYSGMARE